MSHAEPAEELTLVVGAQPVTFTCAARALRISPARLGLPAATVRRAAPRLTASPLYRLAARHCQDLARHADVLSASATADALGGVSVDLLRALLVSAAGEEPTLVAQIRGHVRDHLGDPGLSPASVAAALAVSPRQLYRACAAAGFSLEQWIIATRLARARADLADPRNRRLPIATVARHRGFKDATHFTRRFRAAYGVLPSEWRRTTS